MVITSALFIILLELILVSFVAFGLDHNFGGTGRTALLNDIKQLTRKK